MIESTELLVLEALQKENSLKTVNNYGETLLHIAASNGCGKIVEEILKKSCFEIDHKNVFGWTPLTQAIRNGKIDCVKILIDNGANVNHVTYLGMSAIGLATAIGSEMFEIIYKASPSALGIAAQDEVCPLSITAMKNDKDLFFRLLELGLDISKANILAHCVIKSSRIQEISSLAKLPEDVESFWNDCSDNIEISEEIDSNNNNRQINKMGKHLPKIFIEDTDAKLVDQVNNETSEHKGGIFFDKTNECNPISPTLTYNFDGAYPPSPRTIFPDGGKFFENPTEKKMELITDFQNGDCGIKRCKNIRPPDLVLTHEDQLDFNNSLSFVPEYSPTKSPLVPPEIEDEDAVFGDITPTQAQEKTPPAAFIFNPKDAPMSFFLHSYGLGRFIPIFLEQEVDVELFLTLNNEDLKEIGVESENERRIILSVIDEINDTESDK
ncbi:uncharacterized protein LOC122511931 [Leptopilina heterotoma]|uniref:uncharacterized protein LOC122511931 n=1 Tax=Leptopilina heterotoma TaxID=63436 RepID=UPI001CA92B11|nr:uncharacterized protein LOC122511931 [Leptopilina heterotoma]